MKKNECYLAGNLCRDPQLTTTTNGTDMVKFSLAVNAGYGDKETVTFVNVTLFGKSAAPLHANHAKGDNIEVLGEISLRKYTGRDGIEKQSLDLTARKFWFTQTKSERASNKQSAAAEPQVPDPLGAADTTTADDLPF